MSDCKRVYRFGTDAQGTCVTEGDKSMNFVLGGKGANLAEMSRIGLPVPGGFTITCQTCVEYSGAGNVWPEGALDEIVAAEADLEARCGKKLGDASDPLLVSVRSGALNVRDAFNHIRYFLRFTVRKRVSGKKNIYFKVNSAKFIWNAQPK